MTTRISSRCTSIFPVLTLAAACAVRGSSYASEGVRGHLSNSDQLAFVFCLDSSSGISDFLLRDQRSTGCSSDKSYGVPGGHEQQRAILTDARLAARKE